MREGGNGSKVLLYAAVGLTSAVAAVIGKWYPSVDLSFRLLMPVFAFGWIVHYFRESLGTLWLWMTVIPLFLAHWLLVITFLATIRQLNIWTWLLLVVVELLIASVVVASVSPEARAERSRRKQGV